MNMIKRFTLGEPLSTNAVVADISSESLSDFPLSLELGDKIRISFSAAADEIIFGLGETVRGINKRGWIYESWCSDEGVHTPDKRSLYASHNFIVVDSRFGLFVDFPGKVEWDLGYTASDSCVITVDGDSADVYYIEAESARAIVKAFRGIIGESYIPPRWAFGYQQSCWGYKSPEDFVAVRDGHRKNNLPLDAIYMDIDYMDGFRDFTVNTRSFPDFKAFVADMKANNIHLVPIIDAGVKKEDGYFVYDEGKAKGCLVTDADGGEFDCGVWPGIVALPDFLNTEARKWFGSKYDVLLNCGIDGFWNDMNEPALFFSRKGLERAINELKKLDPDTTDVWGFFGIKNTLMGIQNSMKDYCSFYHDYDGRRVCHKDVHNIYGAFMTRAAAEHFEEVMGKEKVLIFSRSSYIGAHRYSGIWFGDNYSWWEHILLNLRMLPSANMCGFLYCGADLGGFAMNTTPDLLLRWLALGVFTPLMRNHRALGTRAQEAYQFPNTEDFADVLAVRYRLIPYIYKNFRRCSDENEMLFRPLAFDYPDDKLAREVEDQLMLGEECMIAPVYEQNKSGRVVYLPEDMTFVTLSGSKVKTESLSKGIRYVEAALNEVPLFIKKGKKIPLAAPALNTAELDWDNLEYIP